MQNSHPVPPRVQQGPRCTWFDPPDSQRTCDQVGQGHGACLWDPHTGHEVGQDKEGQVSHSPRWPAPAAHVHTDSTLPVYPPRYPKNSTLATSFPLRQRQEATGVRCRLCLGQPVSVLFGY